MDDLIASTGVSYRALTNPRSWTTSFARPSDQGAWQVLLADLRLSQAAVRCHPRRRGRGHAPAARPGLEWCRRGSAAELGGSVVQRHGRDHVRAARQGGWFPTDPIRGFQGKVRRVRHVGGEGSGHVRHGRREERGPRQRGEAHSGELDADKLWAGGAAALDTITERAAAPIIAKYSGVPAMHHLDSGVCTARPKRCGWPTRAT
jgi:hypothetical protein